MAQLVVLNMMSLSLSGCSTLPEPQVKPVSYALSPAQPTSLAQESEALLQQSAEPVAIATLFSAADAFHARSRLIRQASHSLDLQYYIWELDQTGTLLLNELLQAAERGVRVRLLLDDLNAGSEDFGFELLDQHPNAEVRLFNPSADRWLKVFDFLLDADRLNHRMHNKMLIADATFVITGGRNIGDDYFGAGAESNFRDLDLVATGELVQPLSRSFDRFWNGEWSVPLSHMSQSISASQRLMQLNALQNKLRRLKDFPYASMRAGDEPAYSHQRWHRGQVELYFNEPRAPEKQVSSEIKPYLENLLASAQREVLIESAYFIPLEEDLKLFSELAQRGVQVKILTNSLATTDVAVSHAGYKDSRKKLLSSGVQLFELRPDAQAEREGLAAVAGSSQAALHSKILVVDRTEVVVGSFNLDPRSLNINTEMGMVIKSASLTGEVVDFVRTGMQLSNSYQLQLDGQQLVWLTANGEHQVVHRAEPEVGLWARFKTWLVAWLPIKHQL